MQYFGGGGVQDNLHASLRAYVDCFDSPPFPRGWPRGGGIWDQDPVLMRDFRVIRDFEVQWKKTQEMHRNLQNQEHPGIEQQGGGTPDLEELLNEMLEERGLEDDQYF